MKKLNKVLIANRGEIAVRIIRAAKALDIKTVSIFTDVESDALHRRLGDESILIGTHELSDSYLNIPKIIAAAKTSGCDAIHPGYGFLSENPLFVKACEENDLIFVGPSASIMNLMGNKIQARKTAIEAGIPVTEGITGKPAEIIDQSAELPYPVLVKAAAGGGGKGIRIVNQQSELAEALEATSREAKAYFADGSVYVEQYLESPRHIEIQILADHHQNSLYFFERECSLQRRYQKIIEEAPSPSINEEKRIQMCEDAIKLVRKIGYTNAGTLEFLVDKNDNHYFLEMNTRIQVEHPVTEKITGVDLVQLQLMVAANNKLELEQKDIKITGHAIECRVYAEDPANDFIPSPGDLSYYQNPAKNLADIHSVLDKAARIESFFDPMISKVVVHSTDRASAIEKSIEALKNFPIHGIQTNISFLLTLLQSKDYRQNLISTTYCDKNLGNLNKATQKLKEELNHEIPLIGYAAFSLSDKDGNNEFWDSIGWWRQNQRLRIDEGNQIFDLSISELDKQEGLLSIDSDKFSWKIKNSDNGKIEIRINGYLYELFISHDMNGKAWVSYQGHIFNYQRRDFLLVEDFFSGGGIHGQAGDSVVSPMPGKVIKINVAEGDAVKKGDILLIVEAMKMENNIIAPRDAIIEEISIKENEMVDGQSQLISFKSEPKDE